MVYTNGNELDWDEHNLNHAARHNVEPEEVEAALSDPGAARDAHEKERKHFSRRGWGVLTNEVTET